MFYTGVLVCTNKDYVLIRNAIINHCNHLERMSFLNLMKNVSFANLDTSTMTSTQSSLYDYFKSGIPAMDIPSYSKNVPSVSIDATNILFNNETNTIFVSTQTNEPTLVSGFQNFSLSLIDEISWPKRTGRNKTIKGAHFVTVENNEFDTIVLEGINPPSITDYFHLDERLSDIEDITTQPPEAVPPEATPLEEQGEEQENQPIKEAPVSITPVVPIAKEVHNITVHPNQDTLDA